MENDGRYWRRFYAVFCTNLALNYFLNYEFHIILKLRDLEMGEHSSDNLVILVFSMIDEIVF